MSTSPCIERSDPPLGNTAGPAAAPVPAGAVPSGALGHVVEQLWAPVLATGLVRIHVGDDEPGWTDVERYLALPSVDTADILLPAANRRVLAGSLANFRRLRQPAKNAQRAVLGGLARTGVPTPFPTVRVQARSGRAERPVLPAEQIRSDLGTGRLHAAIGVRTGSNRKATLQLVDDDGVPAAFAKFAWDRPSAIGVRREADALTAVGGAAGVTGAPRLLARGTWHGLPYLVTEPLPTESARLRRDQAPTVQELFTLCPIVRRDRAGSTGQFEALRARIGEIADREPTMSASMLDILDRVASVEVSVAARWHGDLAPWNCARDAGGRLWCWDWESSEEDAVAGLDALHLAVTTHTLRGIRCDDRLLEVAYAEATPALVAAGHGPSSRVVVPALYAVTMVERAVALALDHGEWDEGWLRPGEARRLLGFARSAVAALPGRGDS